MAIPSTGYAWGNLESKVDQLVENLMEQENLPGMTVAVTKNGRLILTKGYGWANTNTNKAMEPFMRSRIGSVTKAVVTGPAAWQLMSEKGIDPEQKKLYGTDGVFTNRFNTDILAGPETNKSWYNTITLQNLLDHRSGFTRSGDQAGAAEMFNTNIASLTYEQVHKHFLRTGELRFEPGTDSSYSNHGFGLWTLLIEELSGESYQDYTEKRYLRPIGLHRYIVPESANPEPRDAWSHDYDNQGNPVPSIGFSNADLGLAAGGFRASAQDLTYLMTYLEKTYTESELDAMGWFKSPRGKFSHNGRRGGGTALVVMFSEGYRSLNNLDLSRVHVALVTNIRTSTSLLDDLASNIALAVPTANVSEDFAIKMLLRHDTDIGGNFKDVSIDRSVAVLSNSENNLQIIPYLVNNQGLIRRGEVAEAGTASLVNLVHPDLSSANAVTAFRDADGNLKNIAWQISSSGQITRRGDAVAGSVKGIALTPFPDGKGVITLTKGNQDDFKLVVWELLPSLEIVRRGDISAGAVKDIAVTTTRADFSGVVSATTDDSSKLKLIAWQFNSASKTFSRKGDTEAGEIRGELNIIRAQFNSNDIVVTAFRDDNGNLKLITWSVSASGQIERKDSTSAGSVSLIHLTVAKDGYVIASVKDSDGVLRIIPYQIGKNGEIERFGTDIAGKISRIASSVIIRNGNQFLLTAVQDNESKLRIISWELD